MTIDEIKIGPYTYAVHFLEAQPGNDNFGYHLPHELKIYVYRTGNPQLDLDTLWHEIKHALWYMLGLSQGDEEERIVRPLSTGELMVLKDNPKLFSLFISTLYSEQDG